MGDQSDNDDIDDDQFEKWKARCLAAEADYAACAEAIGVVDEAEGQGSRPGPRDAVVEHIREAVRDAGRYHEAEGRMFEMKEKLAVAVAALRTIREDLGRAAYVKWHDGSSGDGQLSAMCQALGATLKKLGVE
jgi:hypothetical protein